MSAESCFAADNISVTLASPMHSPKGRCWGQASHTRDGITVKAEAYGHSMYECIENLWTEWEAKLSRVPNFIPRLAPPIEDAQFRAVSPGGVNILNDEIPF